MADERIAASLGSGTTVFISTLGTDGMPSCCRAVALRSDDDLATAVVYVPLATSRDVLRDLATTRRLAVVVTKPIEHASIQLKGVSRTARLARDDEEAFVRSRVAGIAQVLERLGIPLRVTMSVSHWPAFAIEMHVEQIFEQTPGPKAGSRLR